jgi:hypothetical protein
MREPQQQHQVIPPDPAATTVTRGHVVSWGWSLIAGFLLLPAGATTWLLWGDAPTLPAVGLTAAALVLALLTWNAGAARGPVVRLHAVVSVLAAGAWMIMATITGPLTRATGGTWFVLWIMGAASWMIHRGLRRGDGGARHDTSGYADLAAAVNLAGSRVQAIRVDGPRVHATIRADRGRQTAAHIAAQAGNLASWFGVGRGGVSVTEDQKDFAVAHATIVATDLLAGELPWPGLSSPGGCITEPVVVGIRENGDPLSFTLPARVNAQVPAPAQHCIICGMTGSGKSRAAWIIGAEVLSRPNAELTICDTIKGPQFLSPFAGHERVTIHDNEQAARRAIEELPALIKQRTGFLGSLGLSDWEPGIPDFRYLVYLIEEGSSSGISKMPAFIKAAETSRSAGVSLISSTQRVTTAHLASGARAQMATILQFGCKKENRPQDYGLSEAVLEAGACPHHWQNKKSSWVYGEVPGSDPDQWHRPARVFFVESGDIAAALSAAPVHGPAAGDSDTRAAKDAFLARLCQLWAENRVIIRPSDFEDVRVEIGRSKAWVSGAFKDLVTRGWVTGGDGVYQFTATFGDLMRRRSGDDAMAPSAR